MSFDQNKNSDKPEAPDQPANTGNASNPSPQNEERLAGSNQLLNEGAEKYLRESGNIEDMPDAREQQEAEDIMRKENKE